MTFPLNIAKALGEAFEALETLLGTADNFSILLSRLGWQVTLNDDQLALVNSVLALSNGLTELADSLAALENDGSDANVGAVVVAAAAIIGALNDLVQSDLSDIAELPDPLNDEVFWREDFAPSLINLLLTDLIQDRAPTLHGFMDMFGLVEPDFTEGDLWWLSAPSRLRWDRLLLAVTDPVEHLKTIYGWRDNLQSSALAAAVGAFGRGLGLQVYQVPISETLRARFFSALSPNSVIRAAEVVFIDTGLTRAGLRILPVQTDDESGIYIEPFITGSASATITPSPSIELALAGSGEASGYGIFLQPGGDQETIGPALAFEQEMHLIWTPDTPQVLIGSPTGARLEVADGDVSITFRGEASDPEIVLAVGGYKTGLQLILTPEDADSFVTELVQNLALETNLAARLVWSNKTGFAIEGSAGFEIIIPLNLDLQVVVISELYAALTFSAELVEITLAITFVAQVPPLTFTIERIGLIIMLTPKEDSSGDVLGGLDVALNFKPPEGVGIALNFLDIVYGGGSSIWTCQGRIQRHDHRGTCHDRHYGHRHYHHPTAG